jgi:hypothetical protein
MWGNRYGYDCSPRARIAFWAALWIFLIPINFSICIHQFANVHDVSWGTKGDNKVSKDLGVVATGKDGATVEAAVPTDQKDINAAYEDAMAVLSTFPPFFPFPFPPFRLSRALNPDAGR